MKYILKPILLIAISLIVYFIVNSLLVFGFIIDFVIRTIVIVCNLIWYFKVENERALKINEVFLQSKDDRRILGVIYFTELIKDSFNPIIVYKEVKKLIEI